jgi:hypothetical protein
MGAQHSRYGRATAFGHFPHPACRLTLVGPRAASCGYRSHRCSNQSWMGSGLRRPVFRARSWIRCLVLPRTRRAGVPCWRAIPARVSRIAGCTANWTPAWPRLGQRWKTLQNEGRVPGPLPGIPDLDGAHRP